VDIAVIGAGPMGLAAAHRLLALGHTVTVYEADKVAGGMSASFDFAGLRIERFYHFICKTDQPYIEHLGELGIGDKLRWVETGMGYYHKGQVKEWGNPVALLRFSGLGLLAKIRYGLMALFSTYRNDWRPLDGLDAVTWLRRWVGAEAWRELWQPLFELKFHDYTDNLSAAWIWARMRRLGRSRKSLMVEQLGYLEGGSDTWIDAVVAAIRAGGGELHLQRAVDEVLLEGGKVRGVRCGEQRYRHQGVISTIPLPFVPDMIPGLPAPVRRAYASLDNIAVVCVLVRLKRPLSPYFWLNVSDPTIRVPGVVEYSNLCAMEGHLVYVPYYLPGEHEDYQHPDQWFLDRSREYLQKINPELRDEDFLALGAGRYRYAQPICPPEFLAGLPPLNPGVEGLRVADTSHYYPEDRSISESIQLGIRLAQSIATDDVDA
jgi:protoporphyrinogen oxidase